ncbi:MAG: MATE family efflux transporter [Clostridia bacterium]|nr:MATE family efflux transporter [Clostridia bacterium]
MDIKLSDHFNYRRLLRFTLPPVVMMIFASLYGVVDGFFVSNFVGKTPFAAVNFIMPFLQLFGPIGFLFGAGGSAIVAKLLGEKKREEANRVFSMLVCITVGLSLFFGALGIVFLPQIASLLGAEGEMLENAVTYGRIVLLGLPFLMVQFEFETFFVTAEKPKLGLCATLIAGFTNIALDALFIVAFNWGIVGAACATAASQVAGGLLPLFYFSRKNTSLLRFTKPVWDLKTLWKTVTNGASELVTHFSLSFVGMLFNIQLLSYAGEDGVAVYGILMYLNFIFISAFIGYSTGVCPIISYHLGAKNLDEVKNIFKKSLVILFSLSAFMLAAGELLAGPLSAIFVSYDGRLLDMTVHAMRLFCLSYLSVGVDIFGSAFFTALGDGKTSAIISFLRTFLLQAATVLILPLWLNLDGIWLADGVANLVALVISTIFFIKERKKFGY